jgi:predicted nucleic acid-binding protein
VFIALEGRRTVAVDRLPDEVAVSAVTIAELSVGVLAAADTETRARRPATLTSAMAFDPVPIDDAVAEAWAELRIRLRDRGLRMPGNDSWIAATAIALRVPVVTQEAELCRGRWPRGHPPLKGADLRRYGPTTTRC